MAKSPQPGRVKTRLSPPLTPRQAAFLAGASLRQTVDAAVGLRGVRKLLVLEGPRPRGLPREIEVTAQADGGLDRRIESAFDSAFASGRGPVLLIGMDTPQVTTRLLEQCFDELSGPGIHGALGLASDGGWWALGLNHFKSGIVEGIPMSTAHTGRLQRQRLDGLGMNTALLPEMRDLDRFEDAIEIARGCQGTGFAQAVLQLTGAKSAEANL